MLLLLLLNWLHRLNLLLLLLLLMEDSSLALAFYGSLVTFSRGIRAVTSLRLPCSSTLGVLSPVTEPGVSSDEGGPAVLTAVVRLTNGLLQDRLLPLLSFLLLLPSRIGGSVVLRLPGPICRRPLLSRLVSSSISCSPLSASAFPLPGVLLVDVRREGPLPSAGEPAVGAPVLRVRRVDLALVRRQRLLPHRRELALGATEQGV